MPKITISTVTYNRPALLKRAIESVLNQTFEDFEYIITNNGSTDNTSMIIDEYAKQDSRIKSVENRNNMVLGILPAMTDISTNSYLFTTLDDDDYIHPQMLEHLYTTLKETNSDIVSVGSKFMYPDGSLSDKYVYDGIYTLDRVDAMFELLKREKINSAMGGKLYKKQLFQNLQLPNVPRIRDIHREYRTMNNIKQMTLTGIPMYFYYRHDNNLSGLNTPEQITPEKMYEHLEANRLRTAWLSQHMPEIKEFVEYSEYSFMISLYNRILKLEVSDCYHIAEEMRLNLISQKDFLINSNFIKPQEIAILQNINLSQF